MFRYRTSIAYGPWRVTREEAAQDALRLRIATEQRDQPDHLQWQTPDGSIETKDDSAE